MVPPNSLNIIVSYRQRHKYIQTLMSWSLMSWKTSHQIHSFIKNVTQNIKNHAHVKKVGHTSKFLFGIY